MTDLTSGYTEFCKFLETHSGICLGKDKRYLVASRLRRLLSENQFADLTELIQNINRPSQNKLKSQVIDAMTTNETLWFRDSHPFRLFAEKMLPDFYARKSARPLRIWSAACSTGQEPYSLSMLIKDYKKRHLIKTSGETIVATDISREALEQAKSGEYASIAIGRGLDQTNLKNNFTDLGDGRFRVNSDIAEPVEFRPLNLQESYALLGKFDIVFCRNVLIYFTAETKQDILTRIHATLNPGGYLMVGATEAVHGLSSLYEMTNCRPGIIYKKI